MQHTCIHAILTIEVIIMSISKDKVRANLIINKDLKRKLEELAVKQNRSFNNLVTTILENYLKPTEK